MTNYPSVEVYKQHKFISHGSGGQKSESRVPAWLGSKNSPPKGSRLGSYLTWWKKEVKNSELSGILLIRIVSPFIRDLPSWLNYHLTDPLPDIFTLRNEDFSIRIWGDTNIQLIAIVKSIYIKMLITLTCYLSHVWGFMVIYICYSWYW